MTCRTRSSRSMSNGPEHVDLETLSRVLGEDVGGSVISTADMLRHWRTIANELKARTHRARDRHLEDPGDAKRSAAYLEHAGKYYAFTRLVYLFGMLIRSARTSLDNDLEALAKAAADDPDRGAPN